MEGEGKGRQGEKGRMKGLGMGQMGSKIGVRKNSNIGKNIKTYYTQQITFSGADMEGCVCRVCEPTQSSPKMLKNALEVFYLIAHFQLISLWENPCCRKVWGWK